MTIITPLRSFKRTRSKPLQCFVCDFLFSNNFWHGHVFVCLFTVKVNFQACGLGSSGFRPKIPHFCSFQIPLSTGQPCNYLHGNAGPLRAGKPVWWIRPSEACQCHFLEQSHRVAPLSISVQILCCLLYSCQTCSCCCSGNSHFRLAPL